MKLALLSNGKYLKIQGVPGVKVTTSGLNSRADTESKTSYTRGSDSVAYPEILFEGGVQQIQLRTERTGIWWRWPYSQGLWRQL